MWLCFAEVRFSSLFTTLRSSEIEILEADVERANQVKIIYLLTNLHVTQQNSFTA